MEKDESKGRGTICKRSTVSDCLSDPQKNSSITYHWSSLGDGRKLAREEMLLAKVIHPPSSLSLLIFLPYRHYLPNLLSMVKTHRKVRKGKKTWSVGKIMDEQVLSLNVFQILKD